MTCSGSLRGGYRARVERLEPMTLRTKGVDSTNSPPRLNIFYVFYVFTRMCVALHVHVYLYYRIINMREYIFACSYTHRSYMVSGHSPRTFPPDFYPG